MFSLPGLLGLLGGRGPVRRTLCRFVRLLLCLLRGLMLTLLVSLFSIRSLLRGAQVAFMSLLPASEYRIVLLLRCVHGIVCYASSASQG